MSPCSYINDMATSDIRSLLLIKRKGAKVADEESVSSSDMKISAAKSKSCKSDCLGKKRRGMPEAQNSANFNQPISVMAVGPPPDLGNVQAFRDNAKRVKVQASTGNSASLAGSINNCLQTTTRKPSDSLLQAYKMAIGTRTQPQLTNQSSNGTVISNSTSFGPSSQNSATTVSTTGPSSAAAAPVSLNSSIINSYLAHKSGQQALTAPAPMQFLDPNELGMSIQNSLNELKNNFKAANEVTESTSHFPSHTQAPKTNQSYQNAITMPAMPGEYKTAVSDTASSELHNSSTAADETQKPHAHMFSRDDSLVNLAMLTAMDGQDTGSYNTSYFTSYLNADNTSGFLHRDDSLIDLAASVEQTNHDNGAGNANGSSQFGNNDDNTDAFSFFDFPNQM